MLPEEERTETEESAVLYGGYDPLSVTLTHLINNKAGIGWTSYAHTGTPVAVYAMGAGAESSAVRMTTPMYSRTRRCHGGTAVSSAA
jgi:alkaline phosphatase